MDGFVHLDVRSYFSLKDGAFSPEDLARRAAELGMRAVAMTDRDGLYGAARFVHACQRNGVRPILGSTLTVRTGGTGARDDDLVLLARDAEGYANLCRLITDAHHNGARGDPHLFPAQVLAHPEGLVALLGPDSTPGRLALAGRHDAAAGAAAPFRDAFGDWAFVSVRNRLEPSSRAELRALLRLSRDSGLRALATNGVRYLVPEDAFLADALECMRRIVPPRRQPRDPHQRGGLPEAGGGHAPRLRVGPRPGGADARGGRRLPVRPGDRAGPLPGLPHAEGTQRGVDPGPTMLARVRGPPPEPDPRGPRPPGPRALDDPADGLRGVLLDRCRHRGRHPGDGDPRGLPGFRRRVAGLLRDRASPTSTRSARPGVRAVHEPATATSCPTSTSTSSPPGERTSTT